MGGLNWDKARQRDLMRDRNTFQSPGREKKKKPARKAVKLKAPFKSEHRPMRRLRGQEEIWRLNLIQYYRGWIQHRPAPRGVHPLRSTEIKGIIYLAIPDRLKQPHLRRKQA